MATATPTPTRTPGDRSKRSHSHHQSDDSSSSVSRFEAYNRLQAAAVAFGEKLPIPEIVALGGQSDGKSSLLEAFFGFRFNVREVEMGTRRPLILQMVHDPSALEPLCRFQEEDSEEYGSPVVSSSTIADIIKSRSEALLKETKTSVSPKPIVMRAEFAHCPNLTIIDTPGFVLKAKKREPENTPQEILSMVKSLASPPHRILVFLQQSSVEWCSSLWLDSIREIDPTFRRTVIVVSKFDNTLKDFSDRWEVDRYLSASGYLGENTRPFFVALPKDRNIASNDEFRRQISQMDAEVLRHLHDGIKGGYDEEKFKPYIGFCSLREYLESELQKRYKKAAPATLALLEQRCSEVNIEPARLDSKIQATSDVSHLRKSAMMHAASISNHVVANILLAKAGRGGGRGTEEAAAEIARTAARSWLAPLLDTACDRLAFVLGNLFGIALERNCSRESEYGGKAGDMDGYVGFHAALRHAYNRFIKGLAKQCKQLVRHHLDSVTSPYSQVFYENDFQGGFGSSASSYFKHNQASAGSFWLELSDGGQVSRDETMRDQENVPPAKQCKKTTPGKGTEARKVLQESQMTVPETPSPDQQCDLVYAGGAKAEVGPRKRMARMTYNRNPEQLMKVHNGGSLLFSNGDSSSTSAYTAICSSAAQHFARIREVLVERGVTSTLNSEFLTPW
ncbi:Dynamin-related protein 5A [Hibiscus syriacus]|uniref:Dynamin-related protein 5A n=1 Tax=Hibiscus syriacus TaxID=106335 RepID=A0A6A3C3N4_HIBSY|nr:Dynamin-related protein 5A [Hibiscus syriacus]